ncbi:peptidase P60 [Nocardia donostiensis]|uniref:C40 family peptidase n=1 Tax=Nocardia donostiensis TaxID=1538463 RepID=UPI0009D92DBF|nr:NlpC/P60 family protein [Nocardia donostiensis]OQS16676.1 peptidase P60 [Nocardia donostiensis]
MPTLNDDLNGVLQSLLELYGAGQPTERAAKALQQEIRDDLRAQAGSGATGYGNLRTMHTTVVDSQANRDGLVHKTVIESATGTVAGRGQLKNHIADFQTRIQAIAAVADTRFSGPALLDTAQTTITNATRQVNADVDAARQQAARIMPPVAPAARSPRTPPPRRRRRRRRYRPRSAGMPRSRRRMRLPSDRTAGGKAVNAANAWLGTPYIWGGGGAGGPSGGGFDCSGLTQYAIAQATDGEVVLPRTTYEQIYAGERVHPRDVRPGDLVFPADSFSSRGPEHVQLAAGGGMVIEAPYSGSHVKWSQMPGNAVVVRVL